MGRPSRSPSPRRRRSKSRERDRERRRSRERERRRSRERRRRSTERERGEHRHRRSWSRSRSRSHEDRNRANKSRQTVQRPYVSDADLQGKSLDEQEMMKQMGFCSFDSTKGKKVENNEDGIVHVILKRKYRQYMNRKGGFNRPLDFVA